MSLTAPTERFTRRVGDYANYRPSWPADLVERLSAEILKPDSVVADIGSGTGIFSKQIAGRVGTVHCIEPNRSMREYSTSYLRECPNVSIRDGRAEATGLPDVSVDVITAAQAFHWFDRPKARNEFRRILRPGGSVALLWYTRITAGDPFLEGYERLLLEYSVDYKEVDHRNITAGAIAEFFHPNRVVNLEAPMTERMELAAIRGRIASSSYTPPEGHPKQAPLLAALEELFNRCQRDGVVEFRYRTNAYVGSLGTKSRTT